MSTPTWGNDPVWLIFFTNGLGWNHQLVTCIDFLIHIQFWHLYSHIFMWIYIYIRAFLFDFVYTYRSFYACKWSGQYGRWNHWLSPNKRASWLIWSEKTFYNLKSSSCPFVWCPSDFCWRSGRISYTWGPFMLHSIWSHCNSNFMPSKMHIVKPPEPTCDFSLK